MDRASGLAVVLLGVGFFVTGFFLATFCAPGFSTCNSRPWADNGVAAALVIFGFFVVAAGLVPFFYTRAAKMPA